jgi:hypothetical protein
MTAQELHGSKAVGRWRPSVHAIEAADIAIAVEHVEQPFDNF